jgi:heme exporter protein A
MARALCGEKIELERGGRRLLTGLTFRVEAGSALLVTGPNGVGKTSLIRVCAGLLKQRGGDVTLEGGDPELTVGEQAHLIGHLNASKPEMTVRENLTFWAEFLGQERGGCSRGGEWIDDVLDRFLLHPLADIPFGYLSAGQKRRAALARLVVAHRPVWLLDEPTSALDSFMRDLFVSIVDEYLRDGGIVMAATHLPLPFAMVTELRLRRSMEASA